MSENQIPEEVLQAIIRFDDACQSWGWQADQGSNGDDIARSHLEHETAREQLISAISRLITPPNLPTREEG